LRISEPARDVAALIALLDDRVAIPFAWHGGRDCASFADAAIVAQTGVSVLGDLRWSTRRDAAAVIDAEGGLERAMDKRLKRAPLALALRGDIAAVPDPLFGIQLLVLEGATLVGPGDHGLMRLPRSAMTIAWDVMSAVRRPHSKSVIAIDREGGAQ
jgi:hypothetical protein